MEGVYQYLLKEVQRVYKQQGVDINDKHVEVIVSQMLVQTEDQRCRETRDLLPGGQYSKVEIEEANEAAVAEGGRPAEAERHSAGYHKSFPGNQFLPVGRILPGDDESPDRCCHQGQE